MTENTPQLTKREYLALKVLEAIIASPGNYSPDEVSALAVVVADVFMSNLDKNPGEVYQELIRLRNDARLTESLKQR